MDQSEDRLRIAAARIDFLDSPDDDLGGVPELVAASWRRSRVAGVDSNSYSVPYHDDLDFDTRLARCARPVLERLSSDMCDVPVSIALADAKARIIDRRDCSGAVGRVLDRVDFNPGFSFEETGVGTNGIGTVFEAGRAVSVVGSAHFNQALIPFACTGAPVLDPLTGRLEGVLDVSLLAETWNPLIHALVKAAATDIGRNLMLDRSRAQQALFEAYVKAEARTHHAVVAVGDTVILNKRAQDLLSPDDQRVVQQHARFLMARTSLRTEHVELSDGRTLRFRVARVEAGGDTSGVVLLVSDAADPDRAVPHPNAHRHASLEPRGGLTDDLPKHRVVAFEEPWMSSSQCPAWNQAKRAVMAALENARPVLLTGEVGSGRVHLLVDVFARKFPGRPVVVVDDPCDLTAPPPTGLLVLRELDGMDEPQVLALSAVLNDLDSDCLLAATTRGPLEGGHPALPLLERFNYSACVPSLRHRAADIRGLAADLLTDLAPKRRIRISPRAERVLAAYSWPGNVPQLRVALAETLVRRPVGEIQVDDLPGYCRSVPQRQLTTLEIAERDAILSALTAEQGNRVRAAVGLGMARSSLYRKLKYYGITEV